MTPNAHFAVTATTERVYRKVWEMSALAGLLVGRGCTRSTDARLRHDYLDRSKSQPARAPRLPAPGTHWRKALRANSGFGGADRSSCGAQRIRRADLFRRRRDVLRAGPVGVRARRSAKVSRVSLDPHLKLLRLRRSVAGGVFGAPTCFCR
jgi:hypothetical protein